MSDASSRYPFDPFPDGWFAACFSDELTVAEPKALTLFGKELVLFRTASGRAVALDAYCPHMGAHFAHGGDVVGETIRCPMHAFRFDRRGDCVATGYGTRTPDNCRVPAWEVLEQDGCVFLWHHHAGVASSWSPPPVDMRGWSPIRTTVCRDLLSHPQETTENSVDLGHFNVVHGYEDIEVLEPLRTEGPYLTTRYAMSRRSFVPRGKPLRAEFHIHVWGLGHSFVDVAIPTHHLRTRHFVFPSPIDGVRVALHLGTAYRANHPIAELVPIRWVDRLVGNFMIREFESDVRQDFDIWNNKRYAHPPMLAKGDGPVLPYRSWAKQFYPSGDPGDSVAVAAE